MTENFQDKLHQEECNNQKVQKFVPVLEENLSVKNTPKLSAKYLQGKTCKTKQMQNIPLTLEGISKSTKNVLGKCSTKEGSSNTITSKVFSKICNRKNLYSNSNTFPWLKVF